MSIASVLLVDDEAAFVETMAERLAIRNIDIISALSGQDALDKLATHPAIEVVILDVKMPIMDGIEALKEIKSKYPLMEVIMLSGQATMETAIEGMKLGAFDYLMKPCDVEQLLAKVKEAAAKRRQHEEKIIEARIKEITSRRP